MPEWSDTSHPPQSLYTRITHYDNDNVVSFRIGSKQKSNHIRGWRIGAGGVDDTAEISKGGTQ